MTNYAGQYPDSSAPFSSEAEEAVLGSILSNVALYFIVASFLTGMDFFLLRHQRIWEAIKRIIERDEEPDFLTVSKELQDMGFLDEIGGQGYLLRLVNNTPTSVKIEAYARVVEKAAIRRRLLTAADEIKALALKEELDIEQVKEQSEALLLGVTDGNTSRTKTTLGSMSGKSYTEILAKREEMAASGQKTVLPLPLHWHRLRERVRSIPFGKMVVISGLEGTGKSAAMEDLAEWCASVGFECDYIHTEQSDEDILDRRMARHANIPFWKLNEPHLLTADEKKRIAEAEQRIAKWQNRLDYHWMPDVTFAALASRLRRSAMMGKKVIFLDHFQDVKVPVEKGMNEVRASEHVVSWLTAFAEMRGIVLIVGSQENKDGATMWTKKLLQKCALRISIKRPVLEEEASYFWGNEKFTLEAKERSPEATWDITKARFGRVGKISQFYHGQGFTWTDLTEVRYAPKVNHPKREPTVNPFSQKPKGKVVELKQ